ncbi:MAG: TetR/AcrR family transcriptional regulator [Desulfobacteraceae bacterium]|nr:TetR/AcrR family transcriptional regulator [Desulfobacteraceae bacterium]
MGTRERRAMEKQLRQNQILDAARNLLFSSGIDNISMNKIAKHAELGIGTIYFYFKSKHEIFIALQMEGVALLYSRLETIHKKKIRSDEKLRLIGRSFYQFCEDHNDYYDIINYFLSSPKIFFEPELKTKVDMSGKKITALIEEVVCQGIKENIFEKEDAGKFAILFFGSLYGLMQFKKFENTILASQTHKDIYEYSIEKLIKSLK